MIVELLDTLEAVLSLRCRKIGLSLKEKMRSDGLIGTEGMDIVPADPMGVND